MIAIVKKSKTHCLRKNFCKRITTRYLASTVFFRAELLHKPPALLGLDQSRLPDIKLVKNSLLKLNLVGVLQRSSIKRPSFGIAYGEAQSFFLNEESLHQLINALWLVYHSNNLRLSHSFFKLINLITERGFKLKELLPSPIYAHSVVTVRKFLSQYARRIRELLPATYLRTYRAGGGSLWSNFVSRQSVVRLTEKQSIISGEVQSNNMLFAGGGILPVLERIYEGIESNYLFYNSSSYQSVKTLYRLTNSLWKIYSGHNLELSRNFSRLINRVTERNQIINAYKSGDIFSTAGSLEQLVNALRRAFSGNSLHLRRNLISLFSDIRTAGERIRVSQTFRPTVFCQTESNNSAVILLYRSFQPRQEIEHTRFTYAGAGDIGEQNAVSNQQLYRYIDEKFSAVNLQREDTERLIMAALKKLKQERVEQWRFDKLQRGMF